MRLLFASCTAALCGLIVQIVVFGIEVAHSDDLYFPEPDWALVPFALATAAEVVAITAIWMYRIAPWILVLLRDSYESERIWRGKAEAFRWINYVIALSMTTRLVIRLLDTGRVGFASFISAAVCLSPMLIPVPKAVSSRPKSRE